MIRENKESKGLRVTKVSKESRESKVILVNEDFKVSKAIKATHSLMQTLLHHSLLHSRAIKVIRVILVQRVLMQL